MPSSILNKIFSARRILLANVQCSLILSISCLALLPTTKAYSAPSCSGVFSVSKLAPDLFFKKLSKFKEDSPAFDAYKAEDVPKAESFQRALLEMFSKVDPSDQITINFRNSLSAKSLTYVPKEEDGTIVAAENAMNTRLKLYGQVLGSIDGSFIVLAPEHTYPNGSTPGGFTVSLFLVRKVSFSSQDPIAIANQLRNKISEAADGSVGTLKEIYAARSGNSPYFDSFNEGAPSATLEINGTSSFYYVKRSIEFWLKEINPDNQSTKKVLELIKEKSN